MKRVTDINFERIGVTLKQILEMSLPTRPTKQSNTRSKGFGDIAVELDAIPPDALRDRVGSAIEKHLPSDQLEILKIAERSERQVPLHIVQQLTGSPGDD